MGEITRFHFGVLQQYLVVFIKVFILLVFVM